MTTYKYVIVGGGMTADAAVGGIRAVDPQGSIGIISAETHPPYNRPPLTKGLWKGEAVDSIWRAAAKQNAQLHLGRQARALDPRNRRVTDDQGGEYTYEKLLLATGGTPRRLPGDNGSVIYFRTFDDYQRLRELADMGKRFAVVGGGFIGWELAAALTMNGKQVTMIFPGQAIGGHIYPSDLARFLTDYYQEKGVNVRRGDSVTTVENARGGVVLKTPGGPEILVDGAAAGLGIQPNVELAQSAGLKVENGIAVDESLRTSAPDIFAAGDVASFVNPSLGKRIRVEHEDNANTMGRAAGESMAGQSVLYHHLPFFYSDLFDLGYEAVGELDPRLEIVEDWKEPYRAGVLYYLKDRRVRGVLLWNIFGQVDAARRLIAEPGPFELPDLKGRLGDAS